MILLRAALAGFSVLGIVSAARAQGSAVSTAPGTAAPPDAERVAGAAPRLRGDARIIGLLATSFGSAARDAGLGFAVGANLGLQRIPLTVGVDVMTAFWGNSTSQQLVRSGNAFVPIDRTRDDRSYFLDASLRLQPVDWRFRPYIEGFAGTKLLQTRYSLSFPNTGTSTSTVSEHAWAASLGWGAGLDIGSVASGSLNFTMGFRRLSGADASFSRAADGAGDVIVRYVGPTSCMIYTLGLTGTFGVADTANSAAH